MHIFIDIENTEVKLLDILLKPVCHWIPGKALFLKNAHVTVEIF